MTPKPLKSDLQRGVSSQVENVDKPFNGKRYTKSSSGVKDKTEVAKFKSVMIFGLWRP
jgi:hypothetical protein